MGDVATADSDTWHSARNVARQEVDVRVPLMERVCAAVVFHLLALTGRAIDVFPTIPSNIPDLQAGPVVQTIGRNRVMDIPGLWCPASLEVSGFTSLVETNSSRLATIRIDTGRTSPPADLCDRRNDPRVCRRINAACRIPRISHNTHYSTGGWGVI